MGKQHSWSISPTTNWLGYSLSQGKLSNIRVFVCYKMRISWIQYCYFYNIQLIEVQHNWAPTQFGLAFKHSISSFDCIKKLCYCFLQSPNVKCKKIQRKKRLGWEKWAKIGDSKKVFATNQRFWQLKNVFWKQTFRQIC